jgi:hypothetical protein
MLKFQMTFTAPDDPREESAEDVIENAQNILMDEGYGDVECRLVD